LNPNELFVDLVLSQTNALYMSLLEDICSSDMCEIIKYTKCGVADIDTLLHPAINGYSVIVDGKAVFTTHVRPISGYPEFEMRDFLEMLLNYPVVKLDVVQRGIIEQFLYIEQSLREHGKVQ